MKKLLLFAFIILSPLLVNAQQKYVYCEIVGTGKLLSTKVTIEVDFGQATKLWSNNRLVDENGKAIKFNSMVDAMNWMGNDGWEFVQAYAISAGGGQNVYHWLLKKEISKLSEEEKNVLLDRLKTKSIVNQEKE